MAGTKAGAEKAKLNPNAEQRGRTSSKAAQAEVRYNLLQQMRSDIAQLCAGANGDKLLPKLLRDIEFLLRQHRDTSRVTATHVCGLQGYDPMQDPQCPGCAQRNPR